MGITDDERSPGNAAESLRLIERERAEAERVLTPDPRLFMWPWGIAWAVGFTLYFLRFGPDGHVFVDMPGWLPLAVLITLFLAAGAVSGIAGAQAGRHVSGPTSAQGAMYGITWSVAFAGISLVLSQVTYLLPAAEQNLLWAGVLVALTGALHMAGGALFRDRVLFALGAWVSVVNVVGVLIGPGWHALIVAVLAGGGMLVAGGWAWAKQRKSLDSTGLHK
jgi:hypothetical protein